MHKVILLLLITCHCLFAFTVPFSNQPVKTDENTCTGFFNADNDDTLKCKQDNKVWFWHNGEKLFMEWEAEIDSTYSESSFRKRDDFSTDNNLRLQIITDVNKFYAYVFYAYPLGGRTDGIRNESNDMNIDGGWNSGYSYKNQISAKTWTCSMEIPLKELRFQGGAPYNWKIILTRYDKNRNTTFTFPYLRPKWNKDYFRKATDIVIAEKIADNDNMLLRPYFVKKYDMMTKEQSFDPENLGFDFSYNPSNSIKVKLSVNPDFSDAPMDVEQNTFNLRDAPWYEENRYFFNEDLDAFGIGSSLFYSRHIMQPRYALKVTGSTPSCSYGFLSSMDKEIMDGEEVVNRDDFFNILAYKPTLDNMSMQFTFLNRENKNYHADVLHLAPVFNFNSNHTAWINTNFSYLDDGVNEIKKGFNTYAGYYGNSDQYNWSVDGGYISEDFTAGMGRIGYDDVNFYYPSCSFGWKDESPSESVKDYGYNLWGSVSYYTTNDDMRYLNTGAKIWIDLQDKFSFNCGGNIDQDNRTGTKYDVPNFFYYASYYNWDILHIELYGDYGELVIHSLDYKNQYNNLTIATNGNINKYIAYNISATRCGYGKFPDGCDADREFWYSNAGTTVNLSNDISITNGLRYNNYGDVNDVGFFSNFRWEFRPDCNLFVGYSTAGDDYEKGEIERSYEQAYCKINYSF